MNILGWWLLGSLLLYMVGLGALLCFVMDQYGDSSFSNNRWFPFAVLAAATPAAVGIFFGFIIIPSILIPSLITEGGYLVLYLVFSYIFWRDVIASVRDR